MEEAAGDTLPLLSLVDGIYAKNSHVELKNGAIIKDVNAAVMDDPSYAVGALYLDAGSTAVIANSSIEHCRSASYNFQSIAAGAVYVSEDSHLCTSAYRGLSTRAGG